MADERLPNLSSSMKEFLAELEDLLESLGHDLLALEEVRTAGREDPELVNSLFRSFHTIKGLAGMLSLKDMGNLAHALEDLLDSVRLGRVELGEENVELLFRGVELLNAQAKVIGTDQGAPGQEEILRLLKRAGEARRDEGEGELERSVDIDVDILRTLTEYEEHRLRENLRGSRNIFLVRRSFPFDTFEGELGALMGALKEEGEIISTLPSASPEDPSSITFVLLWATSLDAAAAAARFSLGEAELVGARRVGGAGGAAPAGEKPPVGGGAAAEGEHKEAGSTTLRSFSDTVRVDIRRLDNLMNIVGELVIYKTHLGEIAREFAGREGMSAEALNLTKAVKALERTLNFLQKGVIEARMVPIGQMFGKLHRVVRKLSRELDKDVELHLSGEDTELDKLVIEDMADPLLHLIRNAIDHGIEPRDARRAAGKPERGTISLSATQRGSHIVIEISDDGAGIDTAKVRRAAEERGLLAPGEEYEDRQVLNALFLPGFSTRELVTEVSGRGVGLDVVKSNVSRLRGMIDIESAPGQGTKVIITLPMTLAIIQALMVKVGEERFAIPISSVLESIRVSGEQVHRVENKEVIRLRDTILPLLRLDDFFGLSSARQNGRLYVVVVGLAEKRLGLVVDSLRGQQEIVIKALGEMLRPVRGIAGATEMGDRRAVLVLDVGALIQEVTHAL